MGAHHLFPPEIGLSADLSNLLVIVGFFIDSQGILSSAISSEWNEPAQSYALMWFDSASYQVMTVLSTKQHYRLGRVSLSETLPRRGAFLSPALAACSSFPPTSLL